MVGGLGGCCDGLPLPGVEGDSESAASALRVAGGSLGRNALANPGSVRYGAVGFIDSRSTNS